VPNATFTYTPNNDLVTTISTTNTGGLANQSVNFTPLYTIVVPNFSFETPNNNGYQYRPTNATWTFLGNSGVTMGGGLDFPSPPIDGIQAAFLQTAGQLSSFSQPFNLVAGYSYIVKAYTSTRNSNGTGQPIEVYWNQFKAGNTFTPSTSTWTDVSFGPFTVPSSNSYTLKFTGTTVAGDNTTYVDNVRISYVIPGPATTITLAGPSTGITGLASEEFTVTANGSLTSNVTISFSDAGAGGTFSPSTVTLGPNIIQVPFTYTAATAGVKTITASNNAGLSNAGTISYTSSNLTSPNDLSGCHLWLKGGAIIGIPSGTNVSTWTSSDTAQRAVTTISGQPKYYSNQYFGHPVVRFDNKTRMTVANMGGNYTSATMFVVFKPDNDNRYSVMATKEIDEWWRYDDGRGYWATFLDSRTDGTIGATFTMPSTGWHTLGMKINSTNLSIKLDSTIGVNNVVHGRTFDAGSTWMIGASAYDEHLFQGDIAEIIVYNRQLSNSEYQFIENYLSNKYSANNNPATALLLAGPSTSSANFESSPFTLETNGSINGNITVTLSDGGQGGIFNPSTIVLTPQSTIAYFTYKGASAGTRSISVSNNGGLANPPAISNTVFTFVNPTSFPNCHLWLQGDAITNIANGSSFSIWKSSDPAARTITATSGSPTLQRNAYNGHSVVRFDGATRFVADNMGGSYTGATLFVMFKPNNDTEYSILSTGASGGQWRRKEDGQGFWSVFLNRYLDAQPPAPAMPTTGWHSLTARVNTNNIVLRVDNVEKTNIDMPQYTNFTTGTKWLIGGAFENFGENFTGDIAEIIVYKTDLTSNEIAVVESYLTNKYNPAQTTPLNMIRSSMFFVIQ